MKKRILILTILTVCAALSSCRKSSNAEKAFSYKDPQTVGGLWTVVDAEGNRFKHCKCVYWGTEDDTVIFESEGATICVSGNVTLVQE